MKRWADTFLLLGSGLLLASFFMTGDIRTATVWTGLVLAIIGTLSHPRV